MYIRTYNCQRNRFFFFSRINAIVHARHVSRRNGKKKKKKFHGDINIKRINKTENFYITTGQSDVYKENENFPNGSKLNFHKMCTQI